MRLTKLLSFGAMIALLVGLASCNKENKNPDPNGKNVDTYVGVSIQFPTISSSLKNLPDDYNKKDGEWQGRDKIETIRVYVVTDNAVINSSSFTTTSFNGIDGQGQLTPKLAVEAKAGQSVKAYVVINDVAGKITSELDKLGAVEFDSKFASTVAKVTAISEVAKTEAKSGGTGHEDIVVMTNKATPQGITVIAGVTEEQAKNGDNNRINVDVTRVVSRAIVTMTNNADKKKMEVKKNITDNTGAVTEKTTATVTITKVEYQVTGNALQFNVIEDAKTWRVPEEVYTYIPSNNVKGPNGFDWNNLQPSPANKMLFTDAGSWKNVTEQASSDVTDIKKALEAEDHSKFVLPVTHDKANYKKGNTTMFEIKVTFTVANNKTEFAAAEDLSTHTGDIFYGLTDGLFYSTLAKAETMDANHDGTAGYTKKQEARKYTNGEMFYYIWLNPDVKYSDTTQKITESPTVRNQVYHAHITGFKELGLTGKSDLPPDEELEKDKTYLSVMLKVLPYTIHSYDLDLGNRY